MGYNTTVLVINDALGEIENDPQFGKKLVAAILMKNTSKDPIDVSAGSHVNAATVVETHHADRTTLIAVGGNNATVLLETQGWRHRDKEMQFRLSEELDVAVTLSLCKRCGSDLRHNGLCPDQTCPYSDYRQTDSFTEE